MSRATRVDVAASEGTEVRVALVEGGGLRMTVLDAAGRAVDPASVELDAIVGEQAQRRAAVIVTRQGAAEASGLLPGRYRARVRAMGHTPVETEPFDVTEGRVTHLPAVTLHRQSYVRVTGVTDAEGRAVTADVRLSIASGGRPAEPAKAFDAGLLPVAPGPVTVIAESTDGRRFERTLDVAEGETVGVEIRLDR